MFNVIIQRYKYCEITLDISFGTRAIRDDREFRMMTLWNPCINVSIRYRLCLSPGDDDMFVGNIRLHIESVKSYYFISRIHTATSRNTN